MPTISSTRQTNSQATSPTVDRLRTKTLSPAYFALVMATGIVSVAAHQTGMRWIALALLGLNVVAYPTLLVLTGLFIYHRFKKRI